jgi:stress response protein SCP2
MSSLNKSLATAEVAIRWDPSPVGEPDHDLDLVAAPYTAQAPYGDPAYLVYFDSRSPDGTIYLNRDSHDGQGLGYDEVMTVELHRLADTYVRLLIGVVIQQQAQRLTFGQVQGTGVRVRADDEVVAVDDFAGVSGSTAAVVAEFVRDASGAWVFRPVLHGFDTDPATFARTMGSAARG